MEMVKATAVEVQCLHFRVLVLYVFVTLLAVGQLITFGYPQLGTVVKVYALFQTAIFTTAVLVAVAFRFVVSIAYMDDPRFVRD